MSDKNPRDIIIRPVVSEKSYAAFDENIYTFVVAGDANKIEIRHAIETIFGVPGHQREHDEPQGQAQAQPPQWRVRLAPRRQARDRLSRPRATASRSSGADDAGPQAQAHQSRSPVPDRLRLRGAHPRQAGEVAHQAQAAHGWTQLLRSHDVASPRWWPQAEVPPGRLPSRQGRRARQGRGHRVRPEPQRADRAAALPRRREALHHRPAGPGSRRPAAERPGFGDPARERAAVALHPRRDHRAQRRAEAGRGRQARPRRRRRRSSSWRRRACSRRCGSRPPRCAASRSTAGAPSARSGTARPGWSRSARRGATAGRASARTCAASP